MEAVYTHLLDPRDPAAHRGRRGARPPRWRPGTASTAAPTEIYDGLLAQHPDAGAEERAELLAQAERSARQAVSFIDAHVLRAEEGHRAGRGVRARRERRRGGR